MNKRFINNEEFFTLSVDAEDALAKLALFTDKEQGSLSTIKNTDTIPSLELQKISHYVWHSRHRDYAANAHIKAKLKAYLQTCPTTNETIGISAKLDLIDAENKNLMGNIAEAKELALSVATKLANIQNFVSLSDTYWLLAWIEADHGNTEGCETNLTLSIEHAINGKDFLRAEISEITLASRVVVRDIKEAEKRWSHKYSNRELILQKFEYDTGLMSAFYDLLGITHTVSNDLAKAVNNFIGTYNTAVETSQVRKAISAGTNISASLVNLNDYDGALIWIEKSIEYTRQTNFLMLLGVPLAIAGSIYQRLKKADKAFDMLAESLKRLKPITNSTMGCFPFQYMGDVERDRGNHHQSLKIFLELEKKSQALNLNNSGLFANALLGQSLALCNLEDIDGAVDVANKLLENSIEFQNINRYMDGVQALASIYHKYKRDKDEQLLQKLLQDEEGEILSQFNLHKQDNELSDYKVENKTLTLYYINVFLRLARNIQTYKVSAEIWEMASGEYALIHEFEMAHKLLKNFIITKNDINTELANNRALAMAIRFETDKSMLDIEHHKQLAIIESNRAKELEMAMGLLKQAQHELIVKNSLLEKISSTDQLTKLKNRRFLTDCIERDISEINRAYDDRRQNNNEDFSFPSLLFFMIDLDYFKTVNDTYGHAIGDEVLVQISQRLQSIFRENDYIIRWGGEEFLVVVKNSNQLDGGTIADKIRDVIRLTPFVLSNNLFLQKTCSIGFCSYPLLKGNGNTVKSLNWQNIVEIADQNLYLVKKSGRNGWAGVTEVNSIQLSAIEKLFNADKHSAFSLLLKSYEESNVSVNSFRSDYLILKSNQS